MSERLDVAKRTISRHLDEIRGLFVEPSRVKVTIVIRPRPGIDGDGDLFFTNGSLEEAFAAARLLDKPENDR